MGGGFHGGGFHGEEAAQRGIRGASSGDGIAATISSPVT
jgi:hypothetical protein